MGSLKSYEDSSPNSGYYIVDHIPNEGFSTLQTTGVADRLFDWVGLNPGDHVPQALVRAMLDVDLLWTGSSLEPPEEADGYLLETLDTHAVRAGLSAKQYRKLVAFCERYDGGRREALLELERELKFKGLSLSENDYPDLESLRQQKNASKTSDEIPSKFENLHKRIFVAEQHLSDVVQESIRRWDADIEGVLDNPYGPIYAQAFTDYPGSVESLQSSEEQVTVRFQAPHPACLFEEVYAPGPTTEIIFQAPDLPDLHYRDADTETDRLKLSKSAWKKFRIRLQGSYPWEHRGRPTSVDTDSEEPLMEDVTTSVRRTTESSSTSDILHKAVIQDYAIVDWETAFDEPDHYKYDTAGRTHPNDLSAIQELAVREQQLGAYRSIACLEKFLPGFSKRPDSGSLNVHDPI
jgi:hypothetical protein